MTKALEEVPCRCHGCQRLLFIARVDNMKPYRVTVGSRRLEKEQLEIKCSRCSVFNYVTIDSD